MPRSMKDQIIAKFACFRAGMRQWERRINDEELAERDNFLKWVKGAGPLDDPPAATSRKRPNESATGGQVKRRRSARVRARVDYREIIPKDEDAILQMLDEADMLDEGSEVFKAAASIHEVDNQGDDEDFQEPGSGESSNEDSKVSKAGSTASADGEELAQGSHEIDIKATLKKLKADREYVQAWINHESSKRVATAKGLTPQIAHFLEHMTGVMEEQVASKSSPKNIIRETKKAYAEFKP